MSYFSRVRVREDRLSDLTYVAPLTVDQFEEEEKGKRIWAGPIGICRVGDTATIQ